MADDVADLERRLDAGEWLRTGQVAALLGTGRTTIHHAIGRGDIKYKSTVGGHRLCDPDDVRALLDKTRRVQGGPAA